MEGEGRGGTAAGRKRSLSSSKSGDTPATHKRRKKSADGGQPAVGAAAKERELEASRARVRELLDRREATERSLVTLEQQIYALETSYLEDTHSRGNILSGMVFLLSFALVITTHHPR